ncbi:MULTISPECIES: hypothetical protein [unclassified Streptomyces]|nr:hypothetical protein OG324_07040 [Streptomyces sp. NBC_01236]
MTVHGIVDRHGKGGITVGHVVSHVIGLACLPPDIRADGHRVP